MWLATGHEPDLEANPALKWIRRHMKISSDYDGENFFTVQNGVRLATPLFVVILLIAIVEVVFAVDSIPAIFAITMDPFIVLTSNVFAILGLRATSRRPAPPPRWPPDSTLVPRASAASAAPVPAWSGCCASVSGPQ